MPVDVRDDVPVVALESLGRIVREPTFDLAVDRDAVVVVEDDEFAEPVRARERAGLVRNALHEAAVAGKHVRVVINDLVPRAVELRGEHFLRERHADTVGKALTQRPGRRLDTQRRLVLRVPGGAAAELPEALDLLETQRVARKVEQRVQQHAAVAG